MIRASLIILFFPSLLSAQLARMSPADPVKNGVFGHAVDINRDGRTAVIGSPAANIRDDLEDFSGTAYVFTRQDTRWSQHAKLMPAEIDRNDAFGSAVSLSGDGRFALVGAPLTAVEGYASGAAYIFACDASGCDERARLLPPQHDPGDLFGISVALDDSGTTAVVGAPGHADYAGSVWVFRRTGSGWSQVVELAPDAPQTHASFGWSVTISGNGDVIWIGEPLHRRDSGPRGVVHVFAQSSDRWRRETVLYPEPGSGAGMFGYALTLDSEASLGVVGAPGVGRNAVSFGSATVFHQIEPGWIPSQTLEPPHPIEAAWFGSSVAVDGSGTFVVVGAPGDTRNGFRSGRAFAFAQWNDLWSLVRDLEPDSVSSDDRFGYAVAIDQRGEHGVVGARESPVNEFDAGLAYTFGPSTLPVSVEPPRLRNPGYPGPSEEGLALELYPNPSQGQCRVRIITASSGDVSLSIFDLTGRMISSVYDGPTQGRKTELVLDTSTLPPGAYLLRLRSGNLEKAVTMVLAF